MANTFNIYSDAYKKAKTIPQIVIFGAAGETIEKMFQLFKFDPRFMIRCNGYGEMVICTKLYAVITVSGGLSQLNIKSHPEIKFICFGGGNPFTGEDSPENLLNLALDDQEIPHKIAEFIDFQGFHGVKYNNALRISYLYGPFEVESKHNIVTLGMRMLREEWKWVKAGCNFRSALKIGQLFNICNRCAAFKKDIKNPQQGSCGICGCRIHSTRKRADNKLALNTTECPAGQWGPEVRVADNLIDGHESQLDQQLTLKKAALERTMNGSSSCNCGKRS